MELALATNIAPALWANESTETVATALTILEERNRK